MKLRCTHNSIRIRIRKSELSVLKESGVIQESIRFPNGELFQFSLLRQQDQETFHAAYQNNKIAIYLPRTMASEWIATDQVSLAHKIALSNGEELDLLVEKDFPCTTRPNEDKADFFGELAQEDNC